MPDFLPSPSLAKSSPGSWGWRSGPTPLRRRFSDVTAWSPRPPQPSSQVAVALTVRDGGHRVCRGAGDGVGQTRVLPAVEEPDQPQLYGAETSRGDL